MTLRHLRTMAGMAILALAVAACGGSGPVGAADAGDQIGEQMSRIADALEDIDDEASARAAAKVIQETTEELKGIAATMETMSVSDRAIAAQQYSQAYAEQQMRIGAVMAKLVQHPEWMAIVSEELEKMSSIAPGS